jgi:phosphopantetheine--protein transferase-like protein
MILAIGIDSVEIERFSHWQTYSQRQLQRVFSPTEITYCMQIPQKSGERFAARFAAREALWKAFCQSWPEHSMAFLSFCRAIEVAHAKRGVPYFILNQDYFGKHISELMALRIVNKQMKILLSLTHTRNTATALTTISNS